MGGRSRGKCDLAGLAIGMNDDVAEGTIIIIGVNPKVGPLGPGGLGRNVPQDHPPSIEAVERPHNRGILAGRRFVDNEGVRDVPGGDGSVPSTLAYMNDGGPSATLTAILNV